MFKLMKCKACNIYTIDEKCPKCGEASVIARPPRYSKEDKYASYRRKERYGV